MSEECPRGDLEFGTIPRMLNQCAAKYGDAPAVVDGDTTLSFVQLQERVAEAARAYMALGVAKGDRVAIWAPNMWEWMVVAMGAHAAGAVVVPVNTRYKGIEAAFLLKKSGAKVLLTVSGFRGNDYVALLAAAKEPLPELEHTVVLRGEVGPGAVSYSDFLARSQEVTPAAAG